MPQERCGLRATKSVKVTDVEINTYTSCTLQSDGTLTAGDTEDFIPMVKTTYNGETFWEANVIPVPDHPIEQVKVNDKEITLSTFITPQSAKVNTITINVGKAAMNPDDLPNPVNSDEDY